MLEFMHKIGRLELQNYIVYKGLPQFNFPRIQKKLNEQKNIEMKDLPDEAEIIDIMNKAKFKAMKDLRDLNVPEIVFENDKCDLFSSRAFVGWTENINSIQTDGVMQNNIDFTNDKYNCLSTINDVILRDYTVKRNINTNCLPLDSPYVKIILNSEKTIVVRKTSLCWLFTKDNYKLSSDRLKRVASKNHSN